jgi:hypothetical protein
MKNEIPFTRSDVPHSHRAPEDHAEAIRVAPASWRTTALPDELQGPASGAPEDVTASSSQSTGARPIRMWVMECPFRKTGSPVLGTFGASSDHVVIFRMEAWKRLCAEVLQLQTTMFEVGSWTED